MIVLDAIWFTTGKGECIGIVLGRDEVTNATKAYIGIADGHDEGLDVQEISKFGAKIYHTEGLERVIEWVKPKQL